MASPQGVSLSSMQQDMEAFKAQMMGMMQQIVTAKAEPVAAQPAPLAATMAPPVMAAPKGKGKGKTLPGNLAAPAFAPPAFQPQMLAPMALAPPIPQVATAPRVAAGAKPCGSKSPNGLCQKCAGPFNAVRHYSLQGVVELDGKGPLDMANLKGRRFLGISTDAGYWGNVLLIGFGKDNLNLRPHNFAALASAMGIAYGHVQQSLTAAQMGHLLTAPVAAQ